MSQCRLLSSLFSPSLGLLWQDDVGIDGGRWDVYTVKVKARSGLFSCWTWSWNVGKLDCLWGLHKFRWPQIGTTTSNLARRQNTLSLSQVWFGPLWIIYHFLQKLLYVGTFKCIKFVGYWLLMVMTDSTKWKSLLRLWSKINMLSAFSFIMFPWLPNGHLFRRNKSSNEKENSEEESEHKGAVNVKVEENDGIGLCGVISSTRSSISWGAPKVCSISSCFQTGKHLLPQIPAAPHPN